VGAKIVRKLIWTMSKNVEDLHQDEALTRQRTVTNGALIHYNFGSCRIFKSFKILLFGVTKDL
jgi:hypothetical protein